MHHYLPFLVIYYLFTPDDTEDEYHFVLICPFYNDLRQMYIKRYLYTRRSMYKFIYLLHSTKLQKT